MLINETLLRKTIDVALAKGADFAEVYLEDAHRKHFSYLDGRPQKAVSGHTRGAGVRVFSGTEQIYTFTNDLSEAGLLRAAKFASEALQAGRPNQAKVPGSLESLGQLENIAQSNTHVWDSLRMADEHARKVSSLITQVNAEMIDTFKTVQIMNSEGVHRQEGRGYLRGMVRAYAEEHGNQEEGYDNIGLLGTSGDWDKINMADLAASAAGQSLRILRSSWVPAGEMPVIINNGFGGVIFHEACGHGLETSSIAKDASVFCGKLGQRVANECVTAIDDGTLLGRYGSLEMDDEGESTQRTVLIENGILKNYIVDKMGARRTGHKVTGSGRRQDYRFAPTSRMRNTFIAPGNSSFEEMVKDVDYGLYAKKLGGGSVSPGTGSYNFAVIEAYMIRNGRIEEQVKGASLIGTGIETLGRISKVSSDLTLAAGTCGAASGLIPTTVGQPQILVTSLTVGGKV